ncbi:MAG: D-alanyl-D-alanine carboxypeptidase/D-alanyl-D-alanine-endopeptidase [Ignavibacteria bacterium]|nr:D-alanyl-D-alanine carboxypeptidase/D-alanyl-D-alanine-endopeptidase [Ignavibacteria bacterium]
MKRIKYTIPLFIFLLQFGFSQTDQPLTPKPVSVYPSIQDFSKALDDIFNDPNFSNSHWGVVIQSLNTGEYFYKRNENKNFMPASNMKLFTSAVGLLDLGPNFQYETSLYLKGKIDDEIVKGDLVIRGSGDPTITARFYNDDPNYVFSSWADSLVELGVEEIRGNIIADDDVFDDVGLGSGWSWDDETYYYSAPVSGVSFNDNCVDVSIMPGETIGSKALITFRPNTRYVTVLNDIATVKDDSVTKLEFYRDRGTNLIHCFGTIRLSEPKYTESISVNNPTQFAAVVFKEILESKGIAVKGYSADIDEFTEALDYTAMTKLFSQLSPKLDQIVNVINKRSNNLYTEQLLKTIGFKHEKVGTTENGIKASEPYLKQMGIDPDNIQIVDGSGLSRMNLITPMQLNNLLRYMYKSKVFKSFYESLPIAGVDGTISRRMKNSRAENNVHAKTGYINSVRSLSGYVTTADGEMLTFVIIANNFLVPLPLAENIQDLVCVLLSNFSRGKK